MVAHVPYVNIRGIVTSMNPPMLMELHDRVRVINNDDNRGYSYDLGVRLNHVAKIVEIRRFENGSIMIGCKNPLWDNDGKPIVFFKARRLEVIKSG